MSYGQREQFPPKVTAKGTELPLMSLKGKPYLQVAHRLVWFREEHPTAEIRTSILKLGENEAVVRAEIMVGGAMVGCGHKKETENNFADFIEKAETGAIGRALAMAGYGTQFDPELDEGERLADAPIQPAKRKKENAANETEEQPQAGAGAAGRAAGKQSKGGQDAAQSSETPAPAGNEAGAGAGAGQASAGKKAKTREELNALIRANAKAAISKKKFADLSAVKAHMQTTYKADAVDTLGDSEAKEFLSYLENLIRS